MRANELHSNRLEESSHTNHMLNSWDFEQLLMELRLNPILHGIDSRDIIILIDRAGQA